MEVLQADGRKPFTEIAAAFGVPEPKPPTMQPWGLRVACLVDPSGILWHIAERRAGNIAD